MRVLLVSTYELGRQPFGLASPAAWLRDVGVEVECLDLSREAFHADRIHADLVAFHLPMHTATRLALPVIERVRRLHPETPICCYGLYAPLNARLLRSRGVTHILGAEYEQALVELVRLPSGTTPDESASRRMPRWSFITPDRRGLPALSRYATLQHGEHRRIVGYTEASRGCKHLCRHCPIVPVYGGRFRVVPVDVVRGDISQQVDAGAEHITFGDPDFFNGIGHATRVIDMMSGDFPSLTYDVTIKIEHLVRHQNVLARLRESGCVLVTSAVESFDDQILFALRKGHTYATIDDALEACHAAGLTVAPTFVAFTPWTTLDTYCDFLTEIDRRQLVDHVAPVQLCLRLLVPEGSLLLADPDIAPHLDLFDDETLVYPWRHPDPHVDRCAHDVAALVGRRLNASRQAVFDDVWSLAHERAGRHAGSRHAPPPSRAVVPYLNEPWYC